MPNYKQLCAELLNWADKTSAHYYAPPEVLVRARAALAEPKPEGPTDEELRDLMYEFTIGTGHGERIDEIGFARAVLARWGK